VRLLPPSALRVASAALRNPANGRRAVALTEKQFRYGFGNAVSEDESCEGRHAQGEARALAESETP
jgi:non-heme chloroperoxidase